MRILVLSLMIAAVSGCGGDDDGDVECSGVEPGWLNGGPATRDSLSTVCIDDGACPPTWSAALDSTATSGDAGTFQGCAATQTGCGVDSLVLNAGTHGWVWHYDHESGVLIGAAHQFTDEVQGMCGVVENHGGRKRAADCAHVVEKQLPNSRCKPEDGGMAEEDAGR